MSAPFNGLQWLSPERKLSGTTRVFLAFVTGTLFALLPMYYLYTGRAAPRPEAAATAPALPAAGDAQRGADGRGSPDTAARFAARMTYELSQTPAEPAPVAAKVAPPAVPVSAPDEILTQRLSPPPTADVVASRVQHARPIIASPPEPRDTTREMEKEARRADYREPLARAPASAPDALPPRTIEGRDVVLPAKPSALATRAITPGPANGPKAEPGERTSALVTGKAPERAPRAGAEVVAGVTPIGRPPEIQSARETPVKAVGGPGPADSVEDRIAATREWLGAAPQSTHTIQIMGTNSEEQLKAQLKTLSRVLEPARIYAFRTVAQGKPAITVVYGAYPDKQAALKALEKLPAVVSANKPVLRTVNGIRTEQKQHGIKTDS